MFITLIDSGYGFTHDSAFGMWEWNIKHASTMEYFLISMVKIRIFQRKTE